MAATANSPLPAAFRYNLKCDLQQVRQAVFELRAFLAKQCVAENELLDIELALVEAANNAVQYAEPTGRQSPILLEAFCCCGQIELRVTDHTPGFDWPESSVLPDPQSEHGRGLFLIRAVMDYAQYVRNIGENVLVMRKRFSESMPQPMG